MYIQRESLFVITVPIDLRRKVQKFGRRFSSGEALRGGTIFSKSFCCYLGHLAWNDYGILAGWLAGWLAGQVYVDVLDLNRSSQ